MSTTTPTKAPVDLTAVAFLIDHLDGELILPSGHDEREFFVDIIRNVQDYIEDQGMARLLAAGRAAAPVFGCGSALDLLTPQAMAEIVAASRAHTYEGPLVEIEVPEDTGYTVSQIALRELLLSVEADAWAALADALNERELDYHRSGYLAGVISTEVRP